MQNIYPINWLRGFKFDASIFAAFFIVVSFFQVFRAIGNYSPIYGGDEYAYIISGYFREQIGLLWERSPLLQKVNNPIYLLIIDTARALFPDVSASIRLFNSVSYCSTIGVCGFIVARQSGWGAAVGSVVLLGLLPSSAYSSGVMPDVPFYCLVTLAIIGGCNVLPSNHRLAAIVAGIGLALAFLIKPHALSAILATIIVVILVSIVICFIERSARALRHGVVMLAIFIIFLYSTLVLFSFVFLPEIKWDPRYPLGVLYYQTVVNMSSSVQAVNIEQLRGVARYEIANILIVLTVIFPFLFILMLKAIEVGYGYRDASQSDRGALCSFLWLLIAIPIGTGVASYYTYLASSVDFVGQGLRLHARYYAFLYIIAIVSSLSVANWRGLLDKQLALPFLGKTSAYKFLAIAWAAVAILNFLNNKKFHVMFQDNIEMFYLFDIFNQEGILNPFVNYWHLALGVVIIISPLLYLIRPRHPFFLCFIIYATSFSISIFQVTKLQHFHSNSIRFRVETGQLLRTVLSGVPDDQILVIGTSVYDQTAHVLYGALCACHVRQVVSGELIDSSIIPKGVRYVFSVDNVPLEMEAERIFNSPAGVLYKISPK